LRCRHFVFPHVIRRGPCSSATADPSPALCPLLNYGVRTSSFVWQLLVIVLTKRRRKTDDYCNQADGTRQTCLFGLPSSFWTMEAGSPNKYTASNMSFGTLRSLGYEGSLKVSQNRLFVASYEIMANCHRKVTIPNHFLVFSFVPYRNPIESLLHSWCLSPRHSPPPCYRPHHQLERGASARSGPRRQVSRRSSGLRRQEPRR
jgi:hypothetical protein